MPMAGCSIITIAPPSSSTSSRWAKPLLEALAKTPPYAHLQRLAGGLQLGLGAQLSRRVSKAPRLRSAPAAARARRRHRTGHRRDSPRLGSHAERTLRRQLPQSHHRVGQAARYEISFADLRHPTGAPLERAPRRPARRRRHEVAGLHQHAVGKFRESSVRSPRDLQRDVDLAAFARLPRHPARYESRGPTFTFCRA